MPLQENHFHANIVQTLPYFLFLPPGAGTDERRWPLLLFLHGSGERGRDLNLLHGHGLLKILQEQPDFPFIVLAPQCPADQIWSSYGDALMALVNQTIASQPVDEARVYLTGLSMGGFGAWYLATEYPDRWAAVAPICGFELSDMLNFPERLRRIAHLPVWAFHGAKDPFVPDEETRVMVDLLRSYGGQAEFTLYPDADHDAWTPTYSNPALYEWFLRHTRPAEA